MAFQGHAMLLKNKTPSNALLFQQSDNPVSNKSDRRLPTTSSLHSSSSNSHYKMSSTKSPTQLLPTYKLRVPTIPNEIKLVDNNKLVSPMSLQEENTILKVRLQKLQNELDAMKKIITPKHRRKARRELEKHSDLVGRQFPKICKDITKDKIWKYVKFINDDSMLDDYNNNTSIGYLFLNYYRTIDTLNTEKIDSIWDEAKDYVSEAIAAKRNAVQTRIKKSFKGNN